MAQIPGYRSVFSRVGLATVAIGGIILALGLTTELWQSDSLTQLHDMHIKKQVKLLASLLTTAIRAEDDLELLGWLGQVESYGFQRGLVYGLDGALLHASQPQ
jgi:hypothetical protein